MNIFSLLIFLTISGTALSDHERSWKLIQQIWSKVLNDNVRKGRSQYSFWRSYPPHQNDYRPNYSDQNGAPRGPVISRPNYSDQYGAPRAPVISRPNYSDQYGAPRAPVISRPNYSDQYMPVSPPGCWCEPPTYPVTTSSQPPPPPVTTPPPPPSPCLQLFTSLQFKLEVPEYSLPGSDCEFIVLPADDVCSLSLTFNWFYLKQSDNCTEEYLEIGGNKLCGDLTGKEVNLWLPIGKTWEIKYQSSSTYHGDYFGFRIQAVQTLCPTTPGPWVWPSTEATTIEDDVIIIDNCEVTGDCEEEGGGRTLALETTTQLIEELPTPGRRIAG